MWQTVGGHPRSLEYVDALLAGGRSRFPDIRKRLLDTASRRLAEHGHDTESYLSAHTSLEAALAEAITVTADDLLLQQLLADLEPIPHAKRLLYGASFYRHPVDLNALLFQLADPDPDLEAADKQRRDAVNQQLNALLDATVASGLVDGGQLHHPIRLQAETLIRQRLPQAPVAMPVSDIAAAVAACVATSLLLHHRAGGESSFVVPATASALQQQLSPAQLVDHHQRAAEYWQWRVRVWPQDSVADIEDLVEAHHHLQSVDDAGDHGQAVALEGIANGLQYRLGEAGRHSEALSYSKQSVRHCRHLATVDPEGFESHLASALNNLGIHLSNLGHREQALAPTEEAIDIYRRLATTNPTAHEPDLAGTLNNLGVRLHNLGHREQALAPAQEAVDIYRRLAIANPEHEPDLAGTLNNLGIRLDGIGHREQALTLTEEAVSIYRRLATTNPTAHEPDLAMALNNLGVRLAYLSRHEQSVACAQEAVAIYRRLATTNPNAFEPDLARSLWNVGWIHVTLQIVADDAVAAVQEAVALFEKLSAQLPEAHRPDLISAVETLIELYRLAGNDAAADEIAARFGIEDS